MNRIENAFKNKPIFMPYYPLGYPDLETSIGVIEVLAKNGADLIEVGLSFSDPLADGPVIQQATQVALEKGITVKKSLEAVKELNSVTTTEDQWAGVQNTAHTYTVVANQAPLYAGGLRAD